MMGIILALTVLVVAGIAGWATVTSVQILARNRESGHLGDRVEELSRSIDKMRSQLEDLSRRQQEDFLALEERLDFTERLLSGPASESPGRDRG